MQESSHTTRESLATLVEASGMEFERRHPRVGDSLGQYRIEGLLGRGGMGVVFVARSLADERVALKYINRAAPTALWRFKHEFRALAGVHHPNLVSLGELHVLANGGAYYTMELVEGCDFVTYVNAEPNPKARMARLLRAATQLVEGVSHLHEIGYIHRDIKPSNVLVTEEGRVVLLDFGLVFELFNSNHRISQTGQVLGTPAYMAPEQTWRKLCLPASDLYSVGVMLFEILYDRQPVLGSTTELIDVKRDRSYQVEIPDEPAYPETLRCLVGDLLATEMGQRPTGREVLQTLHGLQIGGEPSVELTLSEPSPPFETQTFVGRTRELEELMQAHISSVDRGRPVCVCVSGPSGIGKTSLLDQFVATVRERSDRVLILRGRCLASESVPYRGIDEVVDALSVFLRRLPLPQRLALQPRYAGPLVRLFPVLAQLWPNELGIQQEPSEQRNEGILALREVLVRVADRWSLVVVIDDFHRADGDGRRVLAELLRGPKAPAMTLVVSTRAVNEAEVAALGVPDIDIKLGAALDLRALELRPLAGSDARALVDAALSAAGTSSAQRSTLAKEVLAHGESSPFMLIQRVLDIVRVGPTGQGSEDIVGARIARLSALPRELLEYVAVAGAPVRAEIVAAALAHQEIGDTVNLLCSEGLLVRSNISEIDVAHDRIRAATLALIDAPHNQAIHGRLAAALSEFGAAPEALVEHLCAAGQREQARAQALAAADHAASSLAFSRAIHLYQRSLELLEPDSPERGALLRALAQQLANDGRGPEASQLYVEIAQTCTDRCEARSLRRQAALLLLSSGRLRRGLGLLRGVLRELGEHLPRQPLKVAIALIYERQRVALAWSRWRRGRRSAVPMDARTHEVVETLLVGVRGLGAQEHVLTYLFQSRALRLALAYQPSPDLVLLVGAEFLANFARGRELESQRTRAVFEELSTEFDSPEIELLYQGLSVVSAGIEPDFSRVIEDGPRVWARLASYPTVRWFRAVLCAPLALAWLYTGDFNTVRRECERWRIAAIERGNLLRTIEVTSSLALVHLYGGEVERSHELLEQLESSIDTTLFSMSAAATRITYATALAYEGRHEEALAVCKKTVRQARRTGLFTLRLFRCIVEDVCGRCELAQILAADAEPSPIDRRRVIRRIKWLREHGGAMGHGFAVVLRAGLSSLDGREIETYGAWREADLAFTMCGFDAHQAVVRYRLGALGKDPGSEALRDRAERYFEAQGVRDPQRFADLLAPSRLGQVSALSQRGRH